MVGGVRAKSNDAALPSRERRGNAAQNCKSISGVYRPSSPKRLRRGATSPGGILCLTSGLLAKRAILTWRNSPTRAFVQFRVRGLPKVFYSHCIPNFCQNAHRIPFTSLQSWHIRCIGPDWFPYLCTSVETRRFIDPSPYRRFREYT